MLTKFQILFYILGKDFIDHFIGILYALILLVVLQKLKDNTRAVHSNRNVLVVGSLVVISANGQSTSSKSSSTSADSFSVSEKYFFHVCKMFFQYSRVSNNRRVWNNHIGWMFPIKLINAGYGIVVLGGNFQKFNNCRGWNMRVEQEISQNLIIVGQIYPLDFTKLLLYAKIGYCQREI